MSRKLFEQTIPFLRELDRARTSLEVSSLLLGTARRFGAEYLLAGTIPLPGSDRRQQLSNVILEHWPKPWAERYFAHGYIFRDPTIRSVSTCCAAPFLWSEIEPAYREIRSSRRIMEEAGDFGLRSGFTIPLVTLEGTVAGFSLAGARLELSPAERQMLGLAATYALGRTLLLQDTAPPSASLSRREAETLQWAAEGNSEWEIGERMGISEHGVDKHMRSARQKLGTTSRTHAVAEAIRRGLIR